jgi:hypothetical protein
MTISVVEVISAIYQNSMELKFAKIHGCLVRGNVNVDKS